MKSSEIRIGDIIFDNETSRLFSPNGDEVALRAQAREVLAQLAARPGEAVGKAEFIETVWGGAQVSDESLAKCIAEIRKAIGDGEKRVIETLPRKGYRLVAATGDARPLSKALILAGVLAVVVALGALWAIPWSRPAADPPRVAVLPFRDLSPEPFRGHLSDAVSEGIIVDLARFPELVVVSESSSFKFRDTDASYEEIGAKLSARYILDGSQQFDGNTLHVTARLVDSQSGASLWSEETTTDLTSIFEVNQEISSRAAHAIVETVAARTALPSTPAEAHSMLAYFKARHMTIGGLSRERLAEAIELNQSTVAKFPDAPWGYIGLAFNLRTEVRFGWNEDPAEDVLALAEAHAQRAADLAPENYLSYYALGRVKMQQGDVAEAIVFLERAAGLNPSSSHVLNALAQPMLYLGKSSEALEALARAEAIDPMGSFVHHWMKAWVLWQDDQCDGAEASLRSMPNVPTAAMKLQAVIQVCQGDLAAAKGSVETYLVDAPGWSLARERAAQEGIWQHAPSLERWLDALATAEMPST